MSGPTARAYNRPFTCPRSFERGEQLAGRIPGPYAVFRFPAVRNLLLGGVLVRIGAAAQGLAIGWEMYQRTDQPLALGLIGLVQAIPMLLLTLPAGYLADVFDRRRVMVAGLAGT